MFTTFSHKMFDTHLHVKYVFVVYITSVHNKNHLYGKKYIYLCQHSTSVLYCHIQVFIYGGELHIIPQPENPAEVTVLPSGVPTLDAAVQCVRDTVVTTVADINIQTDIQHRIIG